MAGHVEKAKEALRKQAIIGADATALYQQQRLGSLNGGSLESIIGVCWRAALIKLSAE